MNSPIDHPVAEARRTLEAWLEGVPAAPPLEPAALLPGSPDAATAEFVFALLVWEAGEPKAASAARRLAEQFVDLNELRVALVDEIEQAIGLDDSHATERADLIATALMCVFDAEDDVSIDRVARAGTLEVRTFLEDIPGLPAFVIDRVMLLAIGEPRIPVDDRLRSVLAEKGIVGPETPDTDAADLLTRVCQPEDARDAYARREAAAGRLARV